MAELIVVGVRAEAWHKPATVLFKDAVSDRYLPIAASATAAPTRDRSAAGVSTGLVKKLLDALGAPARHVEIGEASAGTDRVHIVVGDGVRVPAGLMEAVSFALDAGVPFRCGDAMLAAEGVSSGEAESASTRWRVADPAPTSAYRLVDLDATTQMEAIQMGDAGDAPMVRPPAGAAMLRIRQGPGSGAVFVLDGDVVTCGRDGNNEIVLDGATVSRKHADFHRQGSGYTIEDLDSLNGTYVNGERVKTAALTAGDEIRIGRYLLTFVPS
ncbi:hypothetical protein GCM10022251_38540 [Phytohabitans flavus]|uniref:FHA domain-containing protein n=1 Tax=Phytohabitans flavus TaxID=1076124 RepID=A0A6F8XVH3_9ACTN|nr:FHA domain-containing protein [Phytohabitans flavus]BCB77823.1 hypothetical protein Pflav_042330 [Phytohabitans flavus]